MLKGLAIVLCDLDNFTLRPSLAVCRQVPLDKLEHPSEEVSHFGAKQKNIVEQQYKMRETINWLLN